MRVLKTTDKVSLKITDDQFINILKFIRDGDRFIDVNGNMIMVNAITGIYSEESVDKTEGLLHDGTKVIKKFGQWVDARDPSVKLDAGYYPELLTGEVQTIEQFEQKRLTANN